MSEIHVACAADARYVAHSAAMLHSVIECGGADVAAHYLHGPTFSLSDARKLAVMFEERGARVVFHEIGDDRLAGLPVQPLFGPVMWYRIFLPELLPEVERVLYLDIDTIVVDSLTPLWKLDLGDCHLGAVTNVFMEYHRHRPAEVGVAAEKYFNSGVLLFNLEVMRRDGFTAALYERATSDPEWLKWPDQDALNLTSSERRLVLHPRWNCMNSLFRRPDLATDVFEARALDEAIAAPAIRHFEGPGPNKPWHLLHERAGRQLYGRHREATPWPDYTLDGDTRWNRVKRLAADLRGSSSRTPATA